MASTGQATTTAGDLNRSSTRRTRRRAALRERKRRRTHELGEIAGNDTKTSRPVLDLAPIHVETLLSRLTASKENLSTRCRIPKLTALAMEMLPSPQVEIARDEKEITRKEAVLVYTASVDSLKGYLSTEYKPCWKIRDIKRPTQGHGGPSKEKAATAQASYVPWASYHDIPAADAKKLADLAPPSFHRLESGMNFVWSKSEDREKVSRELCSQLYDWLLTRNYTPEDASQILSKSKFNIVKVPSIGVCLDVFLPDEAPNLKTMPFPLRFYDNIELKYKVRGQRCPPSFKTLSFTGATYVPPSEYASNLNAALRDQAVVVDIWQEIAYWQANTEVKEIKYPLQEYKVLVLLLEYSRSTIGSGTCTQYANRPASDVRSALSNLPGSFSLSSGERVNIRFPERQDYCTRCHTGKYVGKLCPRRCGSCSFRSEDDCEGCNGCL